ncbi:MAG: S-layer homology domain-containing protein [Desulfotomaculaceae bacterium]|nr:S-layer homology domain-containing protein [Desulfotomaculaceae bacterium]
MYKFRTSLLITMLLLSSLFIFSAFAQTAEDVTVWAETDSAAVTVGSEFTVYYKVATSQELFGDSIDLAIDTNLVEVVNTPTPWTPGNFIPGAIAMVNQLTIDDITGETLAQWGETKLALPGFKGTGTIASVQLKAIKEGTFDIPVFYKNSTDYSIQLFDTTGAALAFTGTGLSIDITEVDTTSPEVYIDSPADNTTVTTDSVNITGHYVDAHIDSIVAAVNSGDYTATLNTVDNTYSVEVPLNEGDNLVTVTAYDKSGNTGTATVNIKSKTQVVISNMILTNNDEPITKPFKAEETLGVTLEGEPGAAESYFVIKDMSNSYVLVEDLVEEAASPGTYKGQYTFSPTDPELDFEYALVAGVLKDENGLAGKYFVEPQVLPNDAGYAAITDAFLAEITGTGLTSYLALGDDLAIGTGATANNGYVQQLAGNLSLTLNNQGQAGMTSQGLLDWVNNPANAAAIAAADIITIDIGGKDMVNAMWTYYSDRNKSVLDAAAAGIETNLAGALDKIKALNADVQVYAMNYFNPLPGGDFTETYTAKMNQSIADAAAAKGAVLVDVYQAFEGKNWDYFNMSATGCVISLDRVAPELNVTAGEYATSLNVTVSGTVSDQSPVTVKVNDSTVAVADGQFSTTVTISEGANTITVVATDAAGNSITVDKTVNYSSAVPEIKLAYHDAKKTVGSGKNVTISLIGNSGLTASYSLAQKSGDPVPTVNGAIMTEGTVKGLYTTTYTTYTPPDNVEATVTVTVSLKNMVNGVEVTKTLKDIVIDTKKPVITSLIVTDLNGKEAKLSGTTEGNIKVDLYSVTASGDIPLNTVASNSEGAFGHPVKLKDTVNKYKAVAIDSAGNLSEPKTVEFKLDTVGPAFKVIATRNNGTVTAGVYASEPVPAGLDEVKLVTGASGPDGVNGFTLDPVPGSDTEWSGEFADDSFIKLMVKGKDASGNLGIGIYTETIIGNAGGQIGSEGEAVQLIIPAGALTTAQAVYGSQEVPSEEEVAAAAALGIDLLNSLQYGPDGTTFEVPVSITIPYAADIDPQQLVILYYNLETQEWEDFTSQITDIDEDNHTVTFWTTHFCQFALALDTTAPNLTIDQPVEGFTTSNGTVTVSGTASGTAAENEAGIVVNVYVNDDIMPRASQTVHTGSYSITVALDQDVANDITVEASDPKSNTSSKIIQVIHDSTIPAIEITKPLGLSDGTKGDTYTIEGKITPANINAAYLAANQNGIITLDENGNFSQEVVLAEGVNTITIQAVKDDVVADSKDVTIIRDSTAPVITITSPANGASISTSSVSIVGTLSKSGTVTVTNGTSTSSQDTTGDDNAFSLAIALSNGSNTIKVNAVDQLGNAATQQQITVTCTVGGGSGGGGGSVSTTVTQTVTSSGGTVNAFSGAAVVKVPAGAVTANVSLTVDRVSASTVATPPLTLKIAGSIYEFGPAGTTFNKPVTITLKYDSAKLAGVSEDNLGIYYLDESTNEWVLIGGVVDKAAKTVSVDVTHFSKYAVMAKVSAFEDIAGHWAKDIIEALLAKGIVTGYNDEEFMPDNSITRAEYSTLLVRMQGIAVGQPAAATFSDVDSSDWSYGYVEAAANAGIVTGYEGAFRPNDTITREEMATMAVRALQLSVGTSELAFTDAGSVSDWARGYVSTAVSEGIILGDKDAGTFRPQDNSTRAEAAAVIYRMYNK